jgi:hypothetical protein
MSAPAVTGAWPALPLEAWRDTRETLHMVTQIVGKVRLMLAPPEPQWANVPLYVTARGLTTGPLPHPDGAFDIDVDLIDHHVAVRTSAGRVGAVVLEPRPVADFYAAFMAELRLLGVDVTITTTPNEVPDPVPFDVDTVHRAYDAGAVTRYFRVLSRVDLVMREYRAPFTGRTTPVHFFWGTFDLACSRYSGKPADPPPGADRIYARSANAEYVCAGWWPGDDRVPEPAFFSYTYPRPPGIETASVQPSAGGWHEELGLFILRYDDVRLAPSPREPILAFLTSTFQAGATLAGWDRSLTG